MVMRATGKFELGKAFEFSFGILFGLSSCFSQVSGAMSIKKIHEHFEILPTWVYVGYAK